LKANRRTEPIQGVCRSAFDQTTGEKPIVRCRHQSKPLELNTGQVFWRFFFLVFFVIECWLWYHIQRLPVRVPAHRLIWFLLRSGQRVLPAMLLAGTCTVLALLVVKLIIEPLLRLWLNPRVDPSSWMFHLSAGESPVAGVAGRWHAAGRWQPGALVLTHRRIWFFPAGWGVEPWSLAREQLARVETAPSRLAGLASIRNWPDRLHFWACDQEHAAFAVADPDAVLAWFGAPERPDGDSSTHRNAPQGVFDV
jgi:hypothetical protein